MALDTAANFAKVTVSTGYDNVATSIVLAAGNGALLPAAPFNATWWNVSDYPDPSDDPNKEIVRVTNISTDTLTVTRGQESIAATTKNTAGKTYKMLAGISAKVLNTDLQTPYNTANGSYLIESSGVTYNVGVGDHLRTIDCDSSGGVNLTCVLLPLAATSNKGLTVTIKKSDSSANAVGILTSATGGVNDGIDGSFEYIDSTSTAPALNGTATVNRTGTTVTLKVLTDPTLKFVVGGLIVVNVVTNTSINGTFVITSMTASTIVYTDVTSGTITNSNDTGTIAGVSTWLTQQFSSITLVSTGVSGTGKQQGWTVQTSRDLVSITGFTNVAYTPGSGIYGDQSGNSVVVPPGAWVFSLGFTLYGTTTGTSLCGIGTIAGNNSTGITQCETRFDLAPVTGAVDCVFFTWSKTVLFPTIFYLKTFITYGAAPNVWGRMTVTRR